MVTWNKGSSMPLFPRLHVPLHFCSSEKEKKGPRSNKASKWRPKVQDNQAKWAQALFFSKNNISPGLVATYTHGLRNRRAHVRPAQDAAQQEAVPIRRPLIPSDKNLGGTAAWATQRTLVSRIACVSSPLSPQPPVSSRRLSLIQQISQLASCLLF